MNLEYLQSFYMTVKYNSISKAAEILHITQPGLSGQLKSLENTLGVSLLNRSNKGVVLTEEGKVVFDYAETLLSIQQNIKTDLMNLHKKQPTLTIGSCKSIGEYALPCSIFTFKYLHNEVNIQMDVSNSDGVIQKLREHAINVGIIQYNPNLTDLVIKPIISDELVLVGNINNAKDSISIDELKEIPLILREEHSGTRNVLEKSFKNIGLNINSLNIIYSLNSSEAIKSSILSGKGFSFLPKLVLEQELKKQLIQIVKIDGLKIYFDYYIASRNHYKFSKYEQMFVDFITSTQRGFC